jgi:hypothetical protein
LSYADGLLNQGTDLDAIESRSLELARAAAERALIFSPHDARSWLVLASIDARFDRASRRAAAALKMSYYTGANDSELMPLRLLVSVRSEALDDTELQQLFQREIRTIIRYKSQLKSAIIAAYKDALPQGKRVIETTLEETDPALLKLLSSGPQHF